MNFFLNTAGFALGRVFLAANSSAQTLNLNCESGNRATEQANCWGFGAVSHTNTPANIVAGTWPVCSNSMSNSSPNASWTLIAVVKTRQRQHHLQSQTGKHDRYQRQRHLQSGQASLHHIRQQQVVWRRGYPCRLVPVHLCGALHQHLATVSWPIPASIANSGNPYKLIIGTASLVLAETTGPTSTIWCCRAFTGLILQTTASRLQQDADNDGIADNDEDYPNDQFRAFNNWFPALGLGTLLFEDLWPNIGDYDLNDLVVDYRFNTVTDALAEVVEIKYTFIVRAVGGQPGKTDLLFNWTT